MFVEVFQVVFVEIQRVEVVEAVECERIELGETIVGEYECHEAG